MSVSRETAHYPKPGCPRCGGLCGLLAAGMPPYGPDEWECTACRHRFATPPVIAQEWEDQVPRKLRYEASHPEVRITLGAGSIWRAVVPGRDTPIVRVELRHLLDVLEALDEPG